jgi:hypothetical protein
MTAANSADQPKDDLMPTQEKLEWVTPKISLMETGDTHGETKATSPNEITDPEHALFPAGPS